MNRLIGNTKRRDWERRWDHELPRQWKRGYIHVDGDDRVEFMDAIKTVGKILVSIAIAWMLAVAIFCISSK